MNVDIPCIEKIIDLLDGVDYFIPNDMHYDDPSQNLHIHLNKGQQVLSGKQVVEFLRFRIPGLQTRLLHDQQYDGSDIRRIEAQQKMIRAIIEQKANTGYITRLSEFVRASLQGVETNISLSDSLMLLKNISKNNPDGINMFTLPGTMQSNTGFYYIMDKKKTDTIINQYFQAN
jgi:anionic cell wall polymer biosynthesis LytR-Cps2A-Psr (LCP) family protein